MYTILGNPLRVINRALLDVLRSVPVQLGFDESVSTSAFVALECGNARSDFTNKLTE